MFSWHIALVSESSETECSSGVSVSKPSNWNLNLNQHCSHTQNLQWHEMFLFWLISGVHPPACLCLSVVFVARSLHLWSAKDSSFSGFSVPAEANMMVVSRSAMMPETALAAVIQAWVPLFPACSADSTKDTWSIQHAERGLKHVFRSVNPAKITSDVLAFHIFND